MTELTKYQMKLMSAERAIKRLAKLAFEIDAKDLAEWMIEGDKLGECKAEDAWFLSTFLEDVSESGIKAFERAKPERPGCVVCGKLTHKWDKRSHTRYCSDKCRQKAYRQRNGSPERISRQNVTV